MQHIYTRDKTEAGQLLLTFKLLKAKSRTIILRLTQSTETLLQKAEETNSAVNEVTVAMNHQLQETHSIASAVQQLTSTIDEVARSASNAAKAATDANQQSKQTLSRVSETLDLYFARPHLRISDALFCPIAALRKQLHSLLCACFRALLSNKIALP